MRARLTPLTLPLVALLAAAPFVPLACVSDDSSAPPPGNDAGLSPDGGFNVGDDGSIATKDGASVDGASNDGTIAPTDGAALDGASPGDGASSDGATGDAALPSGPVTVLVVTASGPESGVLVAFQTAAGAVITSATTGATGSVTQVVPAGSQITAVLGTSTRPSLVTIVAVQAGDVLTVLDTPAPIDVSIEEVDVTSLPAGAPGGATAFQVFASARCSSAPLSGAPLTMELESPCATPEGQFPALAIARSESNTELGYAFQKANNAYTDGGVPDGGVVDIAIGGAWATSGTQTVSASNASSTLYDEGAFAFSEVTGGIPYAQSSSLVFPDAGAATATFPSHPAYADFVQSEVNLLFNDANTVHQGSAQWDSIVAMATRSTTATPASFDLAQALPIVTSAGVGYADPVRPSVSWATSAPVTSGDAAVAVFGWFDGNGAVNGTWTIVAPPKTGLVQAPQLPAGAAGPTSNATYSGPPTIILLDGSFWPGYAAARANTTSVAAYLAQSGANYTGKAVIPPLPVDGTLSLSELIPQAL